MGVVSWHISACPCGWPQLSHEYSCLAARVPLPSFPWPFLEDMPFNQRNFRSSRYRHHGSGLKMSISILGTVLLIRPSHFHHYVTHSLCKCSICSSLAPT